MKPLLWRGCIPRDIGTGQTVGKTRGAVCPLLRRPRLQMRAKVHTPTHSVPGGCREPRTTATDRAQVPRLLEDTHNDPSFPSGQGCPLPRFPCQHSVNPSGPTSAPTWSGLVQSRLSATTRKYREERTGQQAAVCSVPTCSYPERAHGSPGSRGI